MDQQEFEKQAQEILETLNEVTKYENAPTDMIEAVTRIMALEDCLDDLARSFEILQYYSGNNSVGDFARVQATELLKTRVRRPDSSVGSEEMNITVVED